MDPRTSQAGEPSPPAFDDAAGAAPPELGRGWLVLRNCPLGGGGPRVPLALLHPRVGVALVDVGAGGTDAADRFRRALDARRFPAIFGGYPPIVRVVRPAGSPADLGPVLAAGFGEQPPLALAGGDAWIGTARAAIEAEMPLTAPERSPARRRRRRRGPWRAAALAVAGCAAAAALALVLAPSPGHDERSAPRTAALAASNKAPAAAPVFPPEAATAGDASAAFLPKAFAAENTGADAPAASASAQTATEATKDDRFEPAPAAVAAGGDAPQTKGAWPAAVSPDTSGAPSEPRAPADVASAPEESPPQESESPPAGVAAAAETSPRVAESAPVGVAAPPENPPEPMPLPVPPEPPPVARAAASVPLPPASAPANADAAAALDPRQAPKRAAAAAPARRATPPAADADAGGRCREILVRATMGEALSENDRGFLRRGCTPRG